MKEKLIKIILALLFFICLADMPYGYYQLVRFAALLGFAILAYYASEKKDKTEMIIYICLAILFQPVFKIALDRQIWNVVDVIAGIGLIISIFWKRKLNFHHNYQINAKTKSNMKRITGIITGVISFIGAVGFLCFAVYMTATEEVSHDEVLWTLAVIFMALSITVYVISTNFGIGITNAKEINKINIENQILKLQIEQKELKKKLGE
jgi:nitrate/nitrite transporter NarK